MPKRPPVDIVGLSPGEGRIEAIVFGVLIALIVIVPLAAYLAKHL